MSDEDNNNLDEKISVIKPGDEEKVKRGFFKTLKKAAGQVPYSEEVVASYYCAIDHVTPKRSKAALISALAYFVLPVDAIPDIIPGVGFTDDWGILAAAIGYAVKAITDDHRINACIWLGKVESCLELLDDKLTKLSEKILIEETKYAEESESKKFRGLIKKVQQCCKEIKQISLDENNSEEMLVEVQRIWKEIQNLETKLVEIS